MTHGLRSLILVVVLGVVGGCAEEGEGARVEGAIPDGPDAPLQLRALAAAARSRGDWGEAGAHYERLLEIGDRDPRLLVALGRVRLREGRPEEAVPRLEAALRLGVEGPEAVCVDLARASVQSGDRDRAFHWLEEALRRGWAHRPALERDPGFRALHEDDRWPRIVPGPPEGDHGPVEGWRSDLEFLEREIERLHVEGPGARPLEEVRAALVGLRRQLPGLEEQRILPQIQRILRRLGSGHSVVWPVCNRLELRELPLDLYWFPSGLFIIGARPGHERWIGARVIAIGSGRAEDFAADLDSVVTRDNDTGISWFGPKYLKMAPWLLDLGYVESVREIPVTLELASGERRAVAFAPVPVALRNPRLVPPPAPVPAPLWLSRLGEHYWRTRLDRRTCYVQVNQVRDQGSRTLERFGVELRDALRGSRVRELVLDLRHNNGGDPELFRELLRTCLWFETSRRDRRLWVLIGRNTFSAAQNLSNRLEQLTDATFVGEPSGSRPNMVGMTSEVVLPWSGTRVSIGCRRLQDSHPHDERPWIAPQLPVSLTAEDHFAGRDPVLRTVRAIIGR